MKNILCCSVNYSHASILIEPLESRSWIVTELKKKISNFHFLLIYLSHKTIWSKTISVSCQLTSLIIFLIVPVHWDLLIISFKCREATSFKAASEPLSLTLSKCRSLKRYLSADNKLTLNQSTKRLYTGVKLLLLSMWSVVIHYVKIFIFEIHYLFDIQKVFKTFRKFLTFS